jgi:hypothetical protein
MMAGRTRISIRSLLVRCCVAASCLIVWLGSTSPIAAAPVATKPLPWFAASIDTMKESMDTDDVKAQLSDSRISNTVNAGARLNTNYITVDTFWEYPSYTQRWVDAIRATGRHVWFRMHPSQWEDDNGTTGIMTPAQYEQGLRTYILDHPSFFKPGDIFDPCPEASNAPYWNATFGGGWGQHAPDAGTAAFNAFLRDTSNIADAALHSLGIYGVITTVHSLNPFWYLDPHALEPATATRMSVIAIDDYVDSGTTDPTTAVRLRLAHLAAIENRWHLPIILGEMGYPTPSPVSDATQAAVLQAEFQALEAVPYLVGVNYWAAVQASSSIFSGSNGDWTLRPGGLALASFFNKKNQAMNSEDGRFGWEEGTTEGWSGSGVVTGLTASTSMAYRGHDSLAVSFSGSGGGSIATSDALVGLAGGSVLTLHVFVPTGVGQITMRLYVVDTPGKTYSSATSRAVPGTWNTLTLTIPGATQAPLRRLGLAVTSAGPGGVLFVDSLFDSPYLG